MANISLGIFGYFHFLIPAWNFTFDQNNVFFKNRTKMHYFSLLIPKLDGDKWWIVSVYCFVTAI